jgi:hypothetical protein
MTNPYVYLLWEWQEHYREQSELELLNESQCGKKQREVARHTRLEFKIRKS